MLKLWGEGSTCRPIRSASGLVDIKTLNMIKVIIPGGESRQMVPTNKCGVDRIGRK